MELIKWLNELSGAVLAILTFVYTVATIILVYVTQRTIREMQITRKQQMLPQIIIQFDILRRGLCCLILRNSGNSTAKRVSIKFADECAENLRKLGKNNDSLIQELSSGYMTLVQGQREVYSLCSVNHTKLLGAVPLKGIINYTNIFDETKTEEFFIDVMAYGHSLIYGSDSEEAAKIIGKGIEEVTKEIREIKKLFDSQHHDDGR